MTLALLALAILSADPSPEPDDPAADLKKMQGAWEIAEVRGKNAAVLKDVAAKMKFVFEKDKVRVDFPGVDQPPQTFKLAIRRGFGEIDVTSAGAEKPSLGLYKFDKGLLVLCSAEPGQPRPRKFDDPQVTVIVLRRAAG